MEFIEVIKWWGGYFGASGGRNIEHLAVLFILDEELGLLAWSYPNPAISLSLL